MAELRRELTYDVRDVGRSARAMTNPSFYVRKFPWATLAVAAGVGYMLIPKKKKEVVYPDPKTLAELISKNQVGVAGSTSAKESKGVVETLVMMGLTWAARTGLNYLGQRVASAAVKMADKSHPPSESPVEETSETER